MLKVTGLKNNTVRVNISIPIELSKRLKRIKESDYSFNVSAICSQAIIIEVNRWEEMQELTEKEENRRSLNG